MKQKNSVERIAFRFSHEEAAALLKLLDYERLPGTAVCAALPDTATVESLTDAGVVLPCGEHILVDRVAALIFNAAAASGRYLRVEGDAGTALLYKSEKLCVLVEDMGSGQLLLEPVKDMETAMPLFRKCVARSGRGLRYTLSLPGEGSVESTDGVEAFGELLMRLKGS